MKNGYETDLESLNSELGGGGVGGGRYDRDFLPVRKWILVP